MTWNEAHRRCPEVVPANIISKNLVMVSGPADSVAKFSAELQNEGVFARAIDTGGIAFHSPHMSQVVPALKERLQQVCCTSLYLSAFCWLNVCYLCLL